LQRFSSVHGFDQGDRHHINHPVENPDSTTRVLDLVPGAFAEVTPALPDSELIVKMLTDGFKAFSTQMPNVHVYVVGFGIQGGRP
jgi:hypothetical protein